MSGDGLEQPGGRCENTDILHNQKITSHWTLQHYMLHTALYIQHFFTSILGARKDQISILIPLFYHCTEDTQHPPTCGAWLQWESAQMGTHGHTGRYSPGTLRSSQKHTFTNLILRLWNWQLVDTERLIIFFPLDSYLESRQLRDYFLSPFVVLMSTVLSDVVKQPDYQVVIIRIL